MPGRYVTYRLARAGADEMVGKTRAKSKDLNPDYNEEFEFAFDTMRSMSSAALRFEVPL
jgi:Ca2+-dependent lipid-binding protein